MSERPDTHFEQMVLAILGVVAAVAAVIYAILSAWPYLLFYVFPLAALSFLYAGIFWFCTRSDDTKGEVVGERYSDDKCYKPVFKYRSLMTVFPFLVLMNVVVFHCRAPQTQVVEVNQKGKIQRSYPVIEWEWANQAFNETRRSAYGDSWFESLRNTAKHDEIYDRGDIGGISWAALILGGPLIFLFWFGRDDELEESKALFKHLKNAIKHEEGVLRRHIEEHEQVVKERLQPHLKQIEDLKRARHALSEENTVLKAKVEFSKDVPKPPETAKTGGVLDSDIL
jgi:hypothetical protein